MKKILVSLLTAISCIAGAQETLTTENLISPYSFVGQSVSGNAGGVNIRNIFGCCSGGSGAFLDTSTSGIWFSWGQSTVGQTIGINQALSGTGIKVSGFSYSYEWYNYGYNRGTLYSNINVTNNTGSVVQNYFWNHTPTAVDGWNLNAGLKTFDNSYSLASLGSLSMSFTGRDDRGWAGYYGPTVRNANLRLTYTNDSAPPPPQPVPTVPVITTTTTTVVTPTDTVTTEIVTSSPSTTATIDPVTTTTTLTTSPSSTSSTVSATSSTVSTPAAAPTRAGSSSGSTSSAVSMVMRNNAAQQAALQSSNLSASIQQSQQAQDTSASGSSSTGSDAVSLGLSSFSTAAKQMSDSMSTTDPANPTSTRNLLNMMSTKPIDSEQRDKEERAARNVASQSSSASAVGVDLGTGASLTAMATVPQGYAAYSVQLIAQVPFYSTKEIYRSQRTVDNERIRRGLSGRSDAVHQEMVDSQYRGR